MMDQFNVGEEMEYGELGLGHNNDQNTPQLIHFSFCIASDVLSELFIGLVLEQVFSG